MRKQMIAAGLLTGLLLSVVPVMADDATTTQIVTGSSASCSVTITGGASEFVVTIPKTLSYTGTSGTIPYEVKISGDFSGDEQLHVVPDASFELTQIRKESKTATVTQDKTVWSIDELETKGNGSIAYTDLSAGNWTGSFDFHIELKSIPYGADIILSRNDLIKYGISFEGDVTVPSVVIDSDGVSHYVTGLGESVFENRSKLTSIMLPDSIVSIESNAFQNCSALVSVTLPNQLESIKSCTFDGCSALLSINIPTTVTSIERWAFNGCTSLSELAVPDSVTTIGNQAFAGVQHITYTGSATGSPWGAKSMNE